MSIDGFYENKYPQQGKYREHEYHYEEREPYNSHNSYDEHDDHQKWLNIWDKIKNNNKLKLLITIAFIAVLVILIGLIMILWPVIEKLLHYISQNGLQGIIENIWKGTGK